MAKKKPGLVAPSRSERPRRKHDWRNQPRKPAALRRQRSITIRVTEEELGALHEAAEEAGLLMSDYVVTKCLGKNWRPPR